MLHRGMSIAVTGLFRYPLKSCAGQSLQTATLDHLGIRGDRTWMVVDASTGTFLTQRRHPTLALVQSDEDTSGVLTLTFPDGSTATSVPQGDRLTVQCWDAACQADDAGEPLARAMSDYLAISCRIVHLAPDFLRPVISSHFSGQASTAFSDGFPLLLISQASLQALNERLDQPVPMNRFRPNIVIDGCEAFAEDSWSQIQIGAITIDVCKPCPRCTVITVDQSTATKNKAPLAALARFRKQELGVCFGQNCVHHHDGTIQLGASVDIITSH